MPTNTEAARRFEETLKVARLLVRGLFDIYLDGRRLIYVKDCRAAFEPSVFLHIAPRDTTISPWTTGSLGSRTVISTRPWSRRCRYPGAV